MLLQKENHEAVRGFCGFITVTLQEGFWNKVRAVCAITSEMQKKKLIFGEDKPGSNSPAMKNDVQQSHKSVNKWKALRKREGIAGQVAQDV